MCVIRKLAAFVHVPIEIRLRQFIGQYESAPISAKHCVYVGLLRVWFHIQSAPHSPRSDSRNSLQLFSKTQIENRFIKQEEGLIGPIFGVRLIRKETTNCKYHSQ